MSTAEPSDESRGRRRYETPRVIDLGPVSEVTRGGGGGVVLDATGTSL